MEKIKFMLGIIILIFGVTVYAAETTYNIGIKEAPPFATQVDGKWSGLSVDLIERLSTEMNFDYKFVDETDITSLLDSVISLKNDMALSAITVTSERERNMDFSHPYFSTNLGFATRSSNDIISDVIWMGTRIILLLILFIGMLYVVGALIDKIDGDITIDNIHDGAWWALVTFTTTGYGDKVPNTNKGKLFASIWMIVSLFLLSMFISYMSSAMVVKRINDIPPTVNTLYKAKVVVVAGSSSESAISDLNIKYSTVSSLDEGIKLLNSTNGVALVHDDALLKYKLNGRDGISINRLNRKSELYAIVFPQGSTLTEQFNVELIKLVNTQQWANINNTIFGRQ